VANAAAATANQLERAGQSLSSLAKQADEITHRSSRDAEEGGVSVQRAIQGFSRVRDSVAQSTTVIRDMGKRANDISSIVDTINLIAERTNLLSLNASIEAARAGDAGRGFAVVAEEIRNLADRSAKATSDIAAIIKALQDVAQDAVSASNEGLRVIDESNVQAEEGAKGLRKILDGVTDATKIVSQITRAADEQRDAGKHVVTAVTATAEQARLIAVATDEQAKSVTGLVQANSQIRKTSQEVKKAMAEQARAARDILKAAQSTKEQARQIRAATSEQVKTASQIAQATESMRRGAATTARAMSEQATAGEQISRSADELRRNVGSVTKAMAEQATAMAQIASASESMRIQAEQSSRGVKEQARTLREMTAAAQNTTKQIKLITSANKEHSTVSGSLLTVLGEVRQMAERNASSVKRTRGGTDDLVRRASQLTELVDSPSRRRVSSRTPRANGA
jgi:methyl-accepting chemotaxis protein